MLAALIGLAGVVVGAALTGALEMLKQQRQEKALLAGVMRVLELDLIDLSAVLRWSLGGDVARFAASDVERITASWLKYRDLVARRLSPDGWSAVARAFSDNACVAQS